MATHDGSCGFVADPSLRDRVTDAVAEFDRYFDAVVDQPTPQNMDALRAAADRLMRACARVLMELGKSSHNGP